MGPETLKACHLSMPGETNSSMGCIADSNRDLDGKHTEED
jgi:hypothetical protein